MNCPLVTVVIPVYNRENTILRALNSVLQQTYTNMEVIVVDDGSTDATVNLIKDCKDSRVSLICLSCNQGANYARNRGIEAANGQYIAFQDSDDEWLNDKLDKQISFMLERNLKASFSPYILYQGQHSQLMPHERQREHLQEADIVHTLQESNVVGTPTLIIKKEVIEQIGLFNEKMRRLQDYEFVIRLVKRFRLGYIAEPLVRAYRLEQSISTNNEALIDACINLIESHSDFISLKYIIDILLAGNTLFMNGIINWAALDRIIKAVKKAQCAEAGEKCYQRVIEYLHDKYFPVKEMLKGWYVFFTSSIQTGKYAIYGAGAYGHKAYYDMKNENGIPQYFLVTEQNGQKEIEGIPVIALSEHRDYSLPIVIAVSWERQNEIINNLLRLNIHNFCVYPFC